MRAWTSWTTSPRSRTDASPARVPTVALAATIFLAGDAVGAGVTTGTSSMR